MENIDQFIHFAKTDQVAKMSKQVENMNRIVRELLGKAPGFFILKL